MDSAEQVDWTQAQEPKGQEAPCARLQNRSEQETQNDRNETQN